MNVIKKNKKKLKKKPKITYLSGVPQLVLLSLSSPMTLERLISSVFSDFKEGLDVDVFNTYEWDLFSHEEKRQENGITQFGVNSIQWFVSWGE